MADAFISYSRGDLDFVRRLFAALEGRGKDIWVDVEDIGPAAPWAKDLDAAISEADAFVFVMSPRSLASEECAAELETAVGAGKRIIPLCLEPSSPVPEVLTLPNWVPQLGRFTDSFDASVDDLIEAIDTDYDFVRQHTQLGLRARRWGDAGRPRHLLLASEEIADAEAWLDRGRDHSPAPTASHAEFVRASRQSQVFRLRRTRAVVSVALVVAIALAAFALVQRNEAVDKTRVAQSQTLASDATANLDPNPELSVMLALEALGIDRTPQAEEALRKAMPLMRTQRTFTLGAPVAAATFSPDGTSLLTGSDDGRAVLWNVEDGTIARELPRSEESVIRASFAPDGRQLVTASGFEWTVFDVASGAEVRKFDDPNPGGGVAFSPDGAALAIERSTTVELVRLHDDGPTVTFAGHTATVHDVDFDAAGQLLATGSSDGTAKVWRVEDGTLLRTFDGGQRLVDTVALSPDGRTLVTGALAGGDAHVWSVESGTEVATLRGHRGLVYGVDIAPDGQQVVTAGADGTVRVWDPVIGAERTSLLGHTGSVRSVEFDPTGERIVTAGLDGTARIWVVASPEQRASYGTLGGSSAIVAQVSPDGRLVATGYADGSAVVRDLSTGQAVGRPVEHGSEVRAVVFSPDSARLLSVARNGAAAISEVGTQQDPQWLSGVAADAYSADWNAEGKLLAIGTGDGIDLRASDGEPDPVLKQEPPARISGVAFQPGDQRLAATLYQDGVAEWDIHTGAEVKRVDAGDLAGPVAWTRDGRHLAVGDMTAGVVRVFDADTLTEVSAFGGHGGSVRGVAFNPDGNLIASAGQDGATRVWDWRSGKELVALTGHEDAVFSVGFLPANNELVSSSGDGTTRIWSCELCVELDTLIGIAERRVTREFTPEERERYLAPVGRG